MPILAGFLSGLVVGLIELLELPGPWTQSYWPEVREALVADGLIGLAVGAVVALVLRLARARLSRPTLARVALAGAGVSYICLSVAVGRLLGGRTLAPMSLALCLALVLPLAGTLLPSVPRQMLTAATVLTLIAGMLIDLRAAPVSTDTIAAGARAAAGGPNVVVIIWDATRRDHLSVQGYPKPTTPYLDAVARHGVVYDDAYSPATWTVPSHASLFTGLYPSAHGLDDEHERLPAELQTLPEALSAAGYETAAFVANPFLSSRNGFAQGFDTFFEAWRRRRLLADVITRQWQALIARHTDKGAEVILSAVDRWLAHRDAGRPYFLFVNVLDAHPHLWPLQPYRRRFLGDISSLRAAQVPQREYALLAGAVHLDDLDREIVGDLFDGEINYLDAVTETLRRQLRAHNPGRPTLFIVTSDHGSTLGEDGLIGPIGFSEDLAKIPFVIQLPGVFDGGIVRSTPVSLVDVAPTVLEVAGLAPDAMGPLPGQSLLALARDGVVDRPVFSENEIRVTTIHEADAKYGRHPAWLELRSKGAWSHRAGLTWTSDGAAVLRGSDGHDPGEDREHLVDELKRQIVAAVGPPNPGTTLARTHPLEPAEREQLRALGYVQ